MSNKSSEEVALLNNRVFVLVNARDMTAIIPEQIEAATISRDSFLKVTPQTCGKRAFGNVELLNSTREFSGPIWQEASKGLPVSDDLSPAVARALDCISKQSQPDSITALELTPVGLNFVNGRYSYPSGNPNSWHPDDTKRYRSSVLGLSVSLSSAAKRRLDTSQTEIVAVVHRVIAIFPSQFCILVAELEVLGADGRQVSPLALEEVLHVITNRNRVASCGIATVQGSSGIDLQELLLNLLPSGRFEVNEATRLFTHSALIVESFPPNLRTVEAIAFRCARHYTTDYLIDLDKLATDIYTPFRNVLHNYALEGAASVCDGSDGFLLEQFLTRFRQGYLWLTVLAYHEHIYLGWLLGRNPFRSGGAGSALGDLGAIIHDFLQFRLGHNIPLVSNVEMHNQAYHRLRQKMCLNELVQKMTCDVAEVERWLAQQSERQRRIEHNLLEKEKDRRRAWRLKFVWGEILVSAFLMFGLTFLAFDALTRKATQMIWNAEPPHLWGIVYPVCIGLIAAVLRGWQVRSEIYEEPVSDALLEADISGDSVETQAAVGFIAASNISQAGKF